MNVWATRFRPASWTRVRLVLAAISLLPEQFPASTPVYACWRFIQPDIVVIDNAPRGENNGECVNHQGRVEVLQIARPDHDRGHQDESNQCCPCAGANAVRGAGQIAEKRKIQFVLTRDEDPRIHQPQNEGRHGEQAERRPDRPQMVPAITQHQGRKEAAEPTHGADQAGHRSGIRGEVLRHQF